MIPPQQDCKCDDALYKILIENSHDVIMRFDRDHKHLYVNPAVESQTGIPPQDFIGKTHAEMGFPQNLIDLWEKAIDFVFETGKDHRIEFFLPDQLTWIDWFLVPDFDNNGQIRSVITSARDITQSKHTAELLSQSEAKYRSLIENINEAVIVTCDSYVVFHNEQAEQLIGYDYKEIKSRPFVDFVYKDDQESVIERHQKRLQGHPVDESNVFRIVHKSGSPIWINVNTTLIPWEGMLSALHSIQDITVQKLAEIGVQESEGRFRKLASLAFEGVLIHRNGICIDVNPAFEKMFDFNRENLLGKNIVSLIIQPDYLNLVNKNIA